MNRNPKVSVIIPTFNRAQYIAETIKSVLNQTDNDFEIIVVDDGSNDNTREVLKAFINKIKYIYKENAGAASARNVGIKNAQGKYIVFLDSDDLFLPKKLEIQVPILDKYPEIDFVYSDVFYFKEKNKRPILMRSIRPASDGRILKKLFMNTSITSSSVIFRKVCFEKAGLFDESLRLNEDTDMLFRIAIHYKAYFSEYPSVMYRVHSHSKSKNQEGLMESLLTSSERLLRAYPELKNQLGRNVDKRLATLKYSLALACITNNKFSRAKEQFSSSYALCPRPKVYFCILILSIHRVLGNVLLKYIFKGIRALDYFKGIVKTKIFFS